MTAAILRTQTTATVTCDSGNLRHDGDPAECHQIAEAHRDSAGHRVLVIEITTTAYEVSP